MKRAYLFLIIILIMISSCNNVKKDNTPATPDKLQDVNNVKQAIKIEARQWLSGSWKEFNFIYPSDLVLTDGGFNESFFYLDYIDNNNYLEYPIRLYGINEVWGLPLKKVIEERERSDPNGFEGYVKEKEEWVTNSTFYYCYKWILSDYDMRTCEFMKQFAGSIRFLRISSTINAWDENQEIFTKIIQNVR